MLEKSNTWPEQVLDTLNSCWRALLESLSNTQANVRSWSLESSKRIHTSHSKGITVYLTESSAQRPALLLSVKRDLHTVLYLYFQ